ncbi:Ig domain-containing protein [Streptomyces erythrochromogenes]|uniref:Ig domain-containing protein n=1 Tax=Streptomyces erythrochromogenes TaxID=285574 RepID=A0ABZ1Q3W4_9ACTN|nr:Ig domain-containing protein [Streptomyces erythrochromogenes]MCX5583810.1 Ig domain-containing protein [Streptomyces erythrochromogenes]
MSTHLRTPRRLAALAIGLAALLAAPAGPALAAPQVGAAPAIQDVAAAPVVANPGNQVSLQWDSAYLQMTATGGVKPYTWSASNLHLGTSINASTGLISGVLRGSGTRTVTVTARDATGASAPVTFTWRVIRDACPRC